MTSMSAPLSVFARPLTYFDARIYAYHLHEKPGFIWLDTPPSASWPQDMGRYSYMAWDPIDVITARLNESIFQKLRTALGLGQIETDPSLPPWQGGLAGWISYESLHVLEDVPFPSLNPFSNQRGCMGLYDRVLAFDHVYKKCWLIGAPFAENTVENFIPVYTFLQNISIQVPIPFANIVGVENLTPNLDQTAYEASVQKAIDYIYAGDIFQANITRLFEGKRAKNVTPFEIYQSLRIHNPAPFAAYMNLGDYQILSSSPERFVRIKDRQVQTKPIKGTRRASMDPAQDLQIKEELRNAEKDQAENLMIVDLMRNDLSRVCAPGSVNVDPLFEVESYAGIHHLVSTVTGVLEEGEDVFSLLEKTFPGGSITGAPKVRAMEIISELEGVTRGPYCGCIGFIGLDGTSDLNISIRTMTCYEDKLLFQVGCGIVADSDPHEEYLETKTKAHKMLRAIGLEEDVG